MFLICKSFLMTILAVTFSSANYNSDTLKIFDRYQTDLHFLFSCKLRCQQRNRAKLIIPTQYRVTHQSGGENFIKKLNHMHTKASMSIFFSRNGVKNTCENVSGIEIIYVFITHTHLAEYFIAIIVLTESTLCIDCYKEVHYWMNLNE